VGFSGVHITSRLGASDEAVVEQGYFELRHVIGGGEPTAAEHLVAAVSIWARFPGAI